MQTRRKFIFWLSENGVLMGYFLVILFTINSCVKDYPALVGNKIPPTPTPPTSSTSPSNCSCTGASSTSNTTPASSTNTPVSSTTATVSPVDTLNATPPHFSPDGGTFYFSTPVKLTADTIPAQAVYEFSVDNGKSWQEGQQFTLTAGGKILTRFRVGNRPTRSRSASFHIYYQRMLVIGNSIMFHGPAPELGWSNSNGMAASAPEKDFVHLLTGYLQTVNSATTIRLQAGTGLELDFGKPTYAMDEFDGAIQVFKPDLIIVRLGENIVDGDVPVRNFESQFRQFMERIKKVSDDSGQPVRIITTTSVWDKPQADAVIRKVVAEKGYPLVDLSCLVGKGQYFASQYANPGVAVHPNDAGMQQIADLIWAKIQ